MAEIFPNSMKTANSQTQEIQRTSNTGDMKKPVPKHHMIRSLKRSSKEKKHTGER